MRPCLGLNRRKVKQLKDPNENLSDEAESYENYLKTCLEKENEYLKKIYYLEEKLRDIECQIVSSVGEINPGSSFRGNLADQLTYRIGRVMVDGVKRPGRNTLAIPYRLFKIYREYSRHMRR